MLNYKIQYINHYFFILFLMNQILNKSNIYSNPNYGQILNHLNNRSRVKILFIDTSEIMFIDSGGSCFSISAAFIPLWGYDIYAEVLCDLYNSFGLNVNSPRCMDHYEEAKSYLDENDYIKFCLCNSKRWKKLNTTELLN